MRPKNHITNLKCFPQVAAVIGNANAQRELFKVVHSYAWDANSHSILQCFMWDKSAQGFNFWAHIYDGINPYAGGKNG